MYIDTLKLTNFRCFGPEGTTIPLRKDLTVFVGGNGSGKTAVMQALMRLFGITNEQRRIRSQDFHVPVDESDRPKQRELSIEATLAFPELKETNPKKSKAVPAFFQQMACDENGTMKCRIRMEASWHDDNSLEGLIEGETFAITTLNDEFDDSQKLRIKLHDIRYIQIVYVPAIRDAASQITAFLRGRLWRSIEWTDSVKEELDSAGTALNEVFSRENAVSKISEIVTNRWKEVFTAGTDTTPIFRPIDIRLQEFIRQIEVVFHPDERGNDRDLKDLSDGQNSLFHIAMTTAVLDLEAEIQEGKAPGFQADNIALPVLTLFAIEEPENNLSPFYLSRIVKLVQDVSNKSNAQSLISSHSASVLSRIKPEQIRHFRLDMQVRTAIVRSIELPSDLEAAGKYIREAVQAYPEIYFARFVILCEGDSEEIILPRLADTLDIHIDRSFVAIVPLGGRHVNHFWKLLNQLHVPYATLLDLDLGRKQGGWKQIKIICEQLITNGYEPNVVIKDRFEGKWQDVLSDLVKEPINETMDDWIAHLRGFNVFFCDPLDLDWIMLDAFQDEYTKIEDGMIGPSSDANAKQVVLKTENIIDFYETGERAEEYEELFRWYRYLFLGRGKPATHFRVLSTLNKETLKEQMPEELKALLISIQKDLEREST